MLNGAFFVQPGILKKYPVRIHVTLLIYMMDGLMQDRPALFAQSTAGHFPDGLADSLVCTAEYPGPLP